MPHTLSPNAKQRANAKHSFNFQTLKKTAGKEIIHDGSLFFFLLSHGQLEKGMSDETKT